MILHVTKHPEQLAHQFVTHEHCTNPGTCPICDGGLSLCSVCGALEGALLDTCPGIRLTEEQHDWNYAGYGIRMRLLLRKRA